jgi:hypothetical protein
MNTLHLLNRKIINKHHLILLILVLTINIASQTNIPLKVSNNDSGIMTVNKKLGNANIDTINVISPWTISGCIYRQDPTPPTDSELLIMASGKAVILDIELCTDPILDKLKNINPKLLIGIYFNPMETFVDPNLAGIPWKNSLRTDLIDNYDYPASQKSFFVYNPSHDQKIISTWGSNIESMWLMNLSNACPVINNIKYNDYFSTKVIERLKPYKNKIDFLLFDNGLRDIVWLGNSIYTITQGKIPPDIDWNNYNDWCNDPSGQLVDCGNHNTAIDISWRDGTSKILKNLKDSLATKIIVNQPNEFYGDFCDGKMFENIGSFSVPGPSNWNGGQALQNPKEMLDIVDILRGLKLNFNLVQSSNGQASPSTDSINETAIVMSLLYDNALFCFAHNSLVVPEIANKLIGQPKGETIEENGLMIREFENAYAVFDTDSVDKSFLSIIIPFYRGKIIMKTPNNIELNPNKYLHSFSLSQNYPNPWNPSTTINYSIAKAGSVRLTVFNAIGGKVAVLINEYKPAGNYSVQFNADTIPSGVYFYRLESGGYSDVKKLILLK